MGSRISDTLLTGESSLPLLVVDVSFPSPPNLTRGYSRWSPYGLRVVARMPHCRQAKPVVFSFHHEEAAYPAQFYS